MLTRHFLSYTVLKLQEAELYKQVPWLLGSGHFHFTNSSRGKTSPWHTSFPLSPRLIVESSQYHQNNWLHSIATDFPLKALWYLLSNEKCQPLKINIKDSSLYKLQQKPSYHIQASRTKKNCLIHDTCFLSLLTKVAFLYNEKARYLTFKFLKISTYPILEKSWKFIQKYVSQKKLWG